MHRLLCLLTTLVFSFSAYSQEETKVGDWYTPELSIESDAYKVVERIKSDLYTIGADYGNSEPGSEGLIVSLEEASQFFEKLFSVKSILIDEYKKTGARLLIDNFIWSPLFTKSFKMLMEQPELLNGFDTSELLRLPSAEYINSDILEMVYLSDLGKRDSKYDPSVYNKNTMQLMAGQESLSDGFINEVLLGGNKMVSYADQHGIITQLQSTNVNHEKAYKKIFERLVKGPDKSKPKFDYNILSENQNVAIALKTLGKAEVPENYVKYVVLAQNDAYPRVRYAAATALLSSGRVGLISTALDSLALEIEVFEDRLESLAPKTGFGSWFQEPNTYEEKALYEEANRNINELGAVRDKLLDHSNSLAHLSMGAVSCAGALR